MHVARRARGRPSERGSASVELVILFPAVLLIVTALIQYALWFHARSLALAAAQEGVGIARGYGATPAQGQATALRFVAAHGADTLLGPAASATTAGAGQVRMVVTGRSLSVIPGIDGASVRQSATAPVERFTTRNEP